MYKVMIELRDGKVIESKRMTQDEARDVWWTCYSSWGSKESVFAKPLSEDYTFINSNKVIAIWMEKEVEDEIKPN